MQVWGKYYCGNRSDQEDYDVRPTLRELGQNAVAYANYLARINQRLPNPKRQLRSKESKLTRV